jgi:hypothetical protein
VIDAADVAFVLVTRGDQDITAILDAQPFGRHVVWNNVARPFNAKVFGRYLACLETDAPVIAVSDDDCIVRCWDQLLAHYRPGTVIANMTRDHRPGEPPMLGWGALFDRELPWRAFDRWFRAGWEMDWQLTKYPETVFTSLTPCLRVEIGEKNDPASWGHVNLPWADHESRSYRQPDHYTEFDLVLQRAEAVAAGKIASRDIARAELDERLERERRALAAIRP